MMSKWFIIVFSVLLVNSVSRSQAVRSECIPNEDDKRVNCKVTTLQSFDGQPGIDLNEANTLSVSCSDFSFIESRLDSQHFGNLPFLQELHIDTCKIRSLPPRSFAGLSALQKLVLQTENSRWASMALEINLDAFVGLGQLQSLELVQNNIWSIPTGALCFLKSLKSLKLPHNHLVSVSDLGLAAVENRENNKEECHKVGEISTIDLSHNTISDFQHGDLTQVSTTLTFLDLSNNQLDVLGDRCLEDLVKLQGLDLSGNKLAALPIGIFNGTKNLENLYLQNNSLSLIPSGAFEGLDNLKVLNLSHNSIASHLMTKGTFSGLSGIQILDLSYNQITKVDVDVFSSLSSLQILNLHHNKIHTIADSALTNLPSLRILNLSNNEIESVNKLAIKDLIALESLSLDTNQIAFIDLEPNSVHSLKDLALNENRLEKIPAFIRMAKHLRTLDLGDNLIKELSSNDLGSDLLKLYGLRLSGNRLTTLSNMTFSGTPNIHILNVAHNRLKSIDAGTLNGLKELRALRLDNNKLSDMNGLVSSLTRLQWLNVSSNSLQWFDYAFVPSSLEWLDISFNVIGDLGNFYNLQNVGVTTMDASFNKLLAIKKGSLPRGLKNINLRSNEIKVIEPYAFADLFGLKKVDLSSNLIRSFVSDALRVNFREGRPEFRMIGNPFECDCHMEWLGDIKNVKNNFELGHVIDLERLECMVPSRREVQLITSVDPDNFLCKYNAHCSKNCMCCDFYACDCRFQCPDGCECFHDHRWSRNVVQCSERNHQRVPLLIPLDATEVRLDGNRFGHLVETQSFLGRANVREIFLNGSHVTSLGNHTFSGLTNLEVLHLEDNNIREILGDEFKSLVSLKELYLHNNDIVYINEIAFEALRNLRTLTLDGNLLTVFPVWQLLSNPRLTSLTLSRNTWSCECDFIQPFNFFLEKKAIAIKDYDLIQCVSDNVIDENAFKSGQVRCGASVQSQESSLISSDPEKTIKSYNDIDLVSVLVPLTVAFIIVIVGLLAVFVFRKKIKTWLYTKSSQIYEESHRSSGSTSYGSNTNAATPKLFDVYISYALRDSEFVDTTLAPTLEQGTNNYSYKLCLHQRDFPPSASLYDTVSVAIESSASVIVVLSQAYLDSEWPLVRAPIKALSAAELKIVFVVREDNLDLSSYPDLAHLVKTSGTVKWGSPGFLNKLRFFLPEPAFLTFQRNVTLRQVMNAQRPPAPLPPTLHRQQQAFSIYNPSEHTYHSISDPHNNHIYHTVMEHQKHQLMHFRQMPPPPPPPPQLELLLKSHAPSPSSSSPSPLMFHHAHSLSASSGAQLLPGGQESNSSSSSNNNNKCNNSKNAPGEYLV